MSKHGGGKTDFWAEGHEKTWPVQEMTETKVGKIEAAYAVLSNLESGLYL